MFNNKTLSREEKIGSKLLLQEKNRSICWDKFDPFVSMRMQWRASMARHLFHILPGQTILEIGAGDGKFTVAINEVTRGECKITAVVFSDEQKDKIKKNISGSNIKIMQLEAFPGILEGNKFDYIIAHHMLDDEIRNALLCLIKELLKPGGELLLFEPNPWNPYYRVRRLLRKLLPVEWRRPMEVAHLDRIQIFSVLSEIGYTQINALPYDFLYSPIPKFLLWPAQHLSLIMENFPYLRNFAGSLYIWARNPAGDGYQQATVDLCEHDMFFKKVSFVIPCRNEEMNIPFLVKGLKDFYSKYIHEIIIVDDNSFDATFEVASELAENNDFIRVVKRSPPNGVGRALRDGINAAAGEFIVIMDSDFQHIIPEMRDLFDAVAAGADVAVGSRFSRESVLINYAFTKILANRIFHILANLFLQKHFRDISNNLKIFRKRVTDSLVIESDDFAANAETGLKPILAGYKVVEVPISWVNRTATMGFSTFRIFRTGPNYFKLLVGLIWSRITCKLNKNGRKNKRV